VFNNDGLNSVSKFGNSPSLKIRKKNIIFEKKKIMIYRGGERACASFVK
jgi:hypothetical protein